MKKRMGLPGILLLGGIALGTEGLYGVNSINMQEGVYAGVTAEAAEYMAQQSKETVNSRMSVQVQSEEQEEAQSAGRARMTEELEMTEEEVAEVTVHEVPVVASEYADIAIAQVHNYVNVRELPDIESEILGKLYDNSAATVLETTENGWYRVHSGSVEGYVKAEYVVVGDESLARAVGTRLATVTTTTLFVRSEATTESSILTMVPEGDDLLVLNESDNGWVQVSSAEGDGYVSAEYVSLSTEYVHAESKAEEEARLAHEEAQRQAAAKAAEEARIAREREQKARSAGGRSTGSAGNTGGSSASGNSALESSTSESSASQSTGNAETNNTAGVSNGQAVVNYGMQFLGNPYVFGGTSLTNGTDCSGFVQGVYAAFGVKLPRNSAEQRGVGYAVSLDAIQPGDIVCYSGHVGIYAGNNTLLHASNEKTGITLTSPITYRKILAVRRIF